MKIIIIINSPSNPTGGVLDYEDLLEIAKLVKKHKIFIISDKLQNKIACKKSIKQTLV